MDITQKLLDDWSEEIANSYITDGTIPADSVRSLSVDKGLNTEQSKRLCEAVNTTIRKKMTYELKDPQGTFPVVDWKDVVGDIEEITMDKEASLLPSGDWEYFEELMGDNEPITKIASEENGIGKAVVIVDMLKHAKSEAFIHRMNATTVMEKSAAWLNSEFKRDVIKTGSINEAYTITKNHVIKFGAHWDGIVDAYFNKTHNYLDQSIPVKLASLQVIEIDGDVNPNSRFVKEMKSYLDSVDRISKFAKVEKHLSNKISEIISVIGDKYNAV